MHISKRMFQNITKIAKYQTFSKLAVLQPPPPTPLTCKPLRGRVKVAVFGKNLLNHQDFYIPRKFYNAIWNYLVITRNPTPNLSFSFGLFPSIYGEPDDGCLVLGGGIKFLAAKQC